MTSGIDFEWFGDAPVSWPDLAQEMLGRPTRGAGSVFQYSDASTYVVMRMLGAVVGDVRDWLIPRLFDLLEIHNPQWHRCTLGWIVGGSDLFLRTQEPARVGQYVLIDQVQVTVITITAHEEHSDYRLTEIAQAVIPR